MKRFLLFVIALIGTTARPAYASEYKLADLVADVKQVCTQPATQGEHWSVTGGVHGEAGIQVKLLKLANIKGELQFTKEEWSGIQRVLAKDQAGDNANYRDCVRLLTPTFLNKMPQ